MAVSVENKAVAKHASAAFGGTPRVQRYHHDTESLSVDILQCADRPCNGVTAYSTVGLSDHPMFRDDQEFPMRLELAGACATADGLFANILASAAFCVMRTRELYSPGRVMSGYVGEYYPSSTVPHIYLGSPFLWEDSLKTLDCGTKRVARLLVVPVSDAEHEFLKGHGSDALEDRFERRQIDMFDLARPSVA